MPSRLQLPRQPGIELALPGSRSQVSHLKSLLVRHQTIGIKTRGKGTVAVAGCVRDFPGSRGIAEGVLTVFVRHTSCSLVIMETADPSARRDLPEFFDRLVPDDTPWFQPTCEGPDDMPSHIRMAPDGVPRGHEYAWTALEVVIQEGFPKRFATGTTRFTLRSPTRDLRFSHEAAPNPARNHSD